MNMKTDSQQPETVAEAKSEATLAAPYGSTITTPAHADINLPVTRADRQLAYWVTGEQEDAKLTRSAQYIRAYVNQVVEHVLSNARDERPARKPDA
jgi:hypothetical protein